jgi:hypothetical protein
MGHYSDSYEYDANKAWEKKHKDADNELKILIKKLEGADLEDKELVLKILRNIQNYRGFFKVLNTHNG